MKSLSDAGVLGSLTPETILVCDGPALEYHAAWVSLFLVVAGLVIVGRHSGMHHAIQIARECGVAFVHLPAGDRSRLPDGGSRDPHGRTVCVLHHVVASRPHQNGALVAPT